MSFVPGSFARDAPKHTVLSRKPKPRDKKPYDREEEVEEYAPIHTMALPVLAEWDPKSLPDHYFLVLEGKRRTGKSTFAKWMLQFYQSTFSIVWCMTNTKASGYWQEFVGEAFTFDSWNPGAVWKLIQRNDAIIKKYGEDSEEAKELGSSLIILDDVISDNVHSDPMFMRLAVEGRHHLISIILMTQDPKAISPKVRDNTDVAIIFNQKTFRNKESIWHDFMNDTPKDFALALLTQHAVEHNALVSVQTNLNSDIRRCFFKSTGDKTKLADPDYILGGPQQKKIVEEERRKSKRPSKSKPGASSSTGDVHKLTQKEILKGDS